MYRMKEGTTQSEDIANCDKIDEKNVCLPVSTVKIGSSVSPKPQLIPECYLEGLDLDARNPAVLEDFLQLVGIQASERTLVVRVVG